MSDCGGSVPKFDLARRCAVHTKKLIGCFGVNMERLLLTHAGANLLDAKNNFSRSVDIETQESSFCCRGGYGLVRKTHPLPLRNIGAIDDR